MKLRSIAVALVAVVIGVTGATVRSQTPAKPPTRQALVDELVIANHILANEGVLDGYGHVSVRSPENRNHYLLARGIAPAIVTAADVVEYDLDSKPIGGGAVGYLERFIHGE